MSSAFGVTSWRRSSVRDVARIYAPSRTSPPARPTRYTRADIDGLPAPVIRYFEFALTADQPLVERAHIEWAGDFSMRRGRWSAFTAAQDYAVRPPGFVWDASIAVMPLVNVRVRDAYIGGVGSLLARVGGVLRVVNKRGTPEMAEGELMRYLGEAVWYPTALLPSAGVSWRAIDDITATATLTDGATTVSLDLHFGSRGEIVRMSAIRPRDVSGSPVPTPWAAHVSDYARQDGMMVPAAGEAEWVLPSGALPYWRGRPTSIHYAFAP
ncbi:MAG: hypothetical protein M3081_02380 [Gemmatimonadota bacterium]|nr:hypothetical protein [Gemmatimonadota bacterium]